MTHSVQDDVMSGAAGEDNNGGVHTVPGLDDNMDVDNDNINTQLCQGPDESLMVETPETISRTNHDEVLQSNSKRRLSKLQFHLKIVKHGESAPDIQKPESAPELTPTMIKKVDEILASGPPGKVVVSGFNLNLTIEDMKCLYKDNSMLIDANMDFYMRLIQDRNENSGDGYPSLFIFPCFFYALFTGTGERESNNGTFNYKAVEKVTQNVNIFERTLVFFPVCVFCHWRLVVFSLVNGTIKLYNSLGRAYHKETDTRILYVLRFYLLLEFYKKNINNHEILRKILQLGATGSDECIVTAEETPQQRNFTDCGVFVLQVAEYLSRTEKFDFEQKHIPYFRRRMSYETLTKKLLTS